MKEKGPGDLGAGGMESVLGRPDTLVGVIVPFSLEPLSEDPSAPESLRASRICMRTHTIDSDCSFLSSMISSSAGPSSGDTILPSKRLHKPGHHYCAHAARQCKVLTLVLLTSLPCFSGMVSKGVFGDGCGTAGALVNSKRLTGALLSSTIQYAPCRRRITISCHQPQTAWGSATT